MPTHRHDFEFLAQNQTNASRIAGAEALAAFEAVRRQQLDVITKVRASYLRLLNNYALLDLNEKNIASLRQIADVARSRYETGTESATGVFLAETDASKFQETRRDIERMISDEKSQLNILMNRLEMLRASGSSDRLVESAKRRLKLWNVSDENIDQLLKTRKASEFLTLRSPFDGIAQKRRMCPSSRG